MASQLFRSASSSIVAVLTALAATSCCWGPGLAALAGLGGPMGSSLSFIKPLTPYFFAVGGTAICYSWYTHLTPKAVDSCCKSSAMARRPFMQSRAFLVLMTTTFVASVAYEYVYKGMMTGEDESCGCEH